MIKSCVMLGFLFTILTGIGLAENVETGDVEAFKLALEQDGFIVQEGDLGYLDLINYMT